MKRTCQTAENDGFTEFRSPLLFVTGCPRSGTTLLQRMLNAHPQLAVANDTHFIPRALELSGEGLVEQILRDGDVLLSERLAKNVFDYHRFYRLGLSQEQFQKVADRAETYRDLICGLYETFASDEQKRFAGEKTPDYVRRLPLLHRLFPWCKSIHIVRDGRDTALSLLDWSRGERGPARFGLWAECPLAATALWWRWQVRRGVQDAVELGAGRHLLVLYERLVAAPESELRRIINFLGLPYSDEMARFHEGKSQHCPGASAKKAWLPPTAGLRDWRSQLDEAQQQLFEALAGDTLSQLGYECGAGVADPETLKTAHSYRVRWEQDLADRHPTEATA